MATGVLLLGIVLGAVFYWIFGSSSIYPGEEWSWKAPEAAGFSAEKLAAFSERVRGSGCIVHAGEMIHEWGDPYLPNDAASATKVFYTYLTLKAIQQGRIGSLQDRVADWAPELMELNAHLGYKDRDITFHHLLSQTSGYGLVEKPGEAFAYNDRATGLLAWVLFYRVYGRMPMEYDEVINSEVLGDLIGFEHAPTVIHPRTPRGRLRITYRDLARFGLLHLRGGRWNRRQVLRKDLFTKAMGYTIPIDLPRTSGEEAEKIPGVSSIGGGKDEKGHLGCLGYFWWHNRITPDGRRLLPDAPADTFLSGGHGGRFAMIVIPKYDLVIVWFGIWMGEPSRSFDQHGRFRVNEILRELLADRQPIQKPLGSSR